MSVAMRTMQLPLYQLCPPPPREEQKDPEKLLVMHKLSKWPLVAVAASVTMLPLLPCPALHLLVLLPETLR